MRSVGASHIGKVRTENQDRIFFHDQPVGNLKNLYIVADGMGGHRAGGHASSFAVERFVQLIEESKQTDPIELMKSSIASVNQEMIAESQSNEEYRGMGTTFVAANTSDSIFVNPTRSMLSSIRSVLYSVRSLDNTRPLPFS